MEAIGNALGIIFIVLTLLIGTGVFLKRRYIYFGDVATGMFSAWLGCVVGTGFILGLIFWLAAGIISAIISFIMNYWMGILGIIVLLIGICIWCGLFEPADSENANENSDENPKSKRTGIVVCCVGIVVLAIGVFGHGGKETPKNIQQSSINQKVNANNNKAPMAPEEVIRVYSNMVLKYDDSGTEKFTNKIRLVDDVFVRLFDGRSSKEKEDRDRNDLKERFNGTLWFQNIHVKLTEEQLNKIVDAHINLQKKAKFDTKIISDDKKGVIRLAVQCIDSALMEKTFEDFLKREIPKRFAAYKPGTSFLDFIQAAPQEQIGNLLVEATEYTCEHPAFKASMTNIDVTFSRDTENDEVLRIDKIPEVCLSFWDKKYAEIFFDNNMFFAHMK